MLEKNLRKGLKRRFKRLAEQGDITLHVYKQNDFDKALAILPEFLSTHALRWPNAYKAKHFHENILRNGMPAGIVHFSELRLNDKPISWRLGFVDRDRYYAYMSAFNSNFELFSPGKIHRLKTIEEAICLQLKIYDCLRGTENYKNKLASHINNLYDFTVRRKCLSSWAKCIALDSIKTMVTPAKS